jgi:hypothetical protein
VSDSWNPGGRGGIIQHVLACQDVGFQVELGHEGQVGVPGMEILVATNVLDSNPKLELGQKFV